MLVYSCSVLGDTRPCPDERPYPRGTTACDSCPWKETLASYQAGELSTLRDSEVFNHTIRVSVVCDVDRRVDVNDVFEKVTETELMFKDVFGDSITEDNGDDVMLEVLTGICDYYDEIDDCNLYPVCREGGVGYGCDPHSGQSFADSGGVATHAAIVPWLPEGTYWWVRGNRYGNLQHEFTHLLDYTYMRTDNQRGTDLDWWVEGMPQFIQWKILKDQLSWDRGNDDARLKDIFTHRSNTRDYYDGMRVFAYLHRHAPYWLEVLAGDVQQGIYRNADSKLAWRGLLGNLSSRHEQQYRDFVRFGNRFRRMEPQTDQDVIGIVEGFGEPEYVIPVRPKKLD